MHDLDRDCHTAVIRNILADDKFTVYLSSMERDTVELFRHLLSQRFERLVVVLCPPVGKIAFLVELGPVIVECMGDLMTYGSNKRTAQEEKTNRT